MSTRILMTISISWLVFVGAVVLPARGQTCDPVWANGVGDPGLDSPVWSLCSTQRDSPIGPALYVGGQFSTAGGMPAKSIAKWDGSAWSPLGTGAENGGVVYALAVSETDGLLYVGGAFGNMGGQAGTKRIAKWNGTAWSDVGGGMSENNAGIRALAFYGEDLYAGGYLNEIGGITAHKIAYWDGASWSALPGDPLGSTDVVRALAVYDGGATEALYVGGEFESAGGSTDARNIFRWDGVTLAPLGRGANDDVEALAVFDGDLYVGGQFTEVTQSDGTVVAAQKVAKWDGASWSAVGVGMGTSVSTHVWTLAVFNDDGAGDDLYAGGSFSTPASRIARWDGSDWSGVTEGSGLNGYVYALSVFGDGYHTGLYVGGTFSANDGEAAQKITAWQSPSPVTPANADADPPMICSGDSATLTASLEGAEIDWYTGDCGGTFIETGDSILVSPDSTTTYHARARNGTTGCVSAGCDTVTVTVSEGPATPTNAHADPDTLCGGGFANLAASVSGAEIDWYTGSCGGTYVDTADVLIVYLTTTTTYYARARDQAGCESPDCMAVTVTVWPRGTGDADGNGFVNGEDIDEFVEQVLTPEPSSQAYCAADTNGDSVVTLADVPLFVNAVLSP
ncbi:MAG: hypothetical protein JXQ75_18540 [Phycisphaerae bacterium]|nr:hypothetical protein [Phycisphaerae bacterium]